MGSHFCPEKNYGRICWWIWCEILMNIKSPTFQAAVLIKTNQPLEILDVLVPELLTGQVLVKIFYAGVCHSQLMEVTGARGEDNYLPHMLGHEGVGEVIEIGKNIAKVGVGDHVVLS